VVSGCKPRLTATTAIKTAYFSTADSPTTSEKYRFIASLRLSVGQSPKKAGFWLISAYKHCDISRKAAKAPSYN
jgi:hypothetical protein